MGYMLQTWAVITLGTWMEMFNCTLALITRYFIVNTLTSTFDILYHNGNSAIPSMTVFSPSAPTCCAPLLPVISSINLNHDSYLCLSKDDPVGLLSEMMVWCF